MMDKPSVEIWKHAPSGRAWIVELTEDRPAGCYGPVADGTELGRVVLETLAIERNGELLRALHRARDQFLRIRHAG
jgi:hypothetical protein